MKILQVCSGVESMDEVIAKECRPVLAAAAQQLPGNQHMRPFAIKHARQQAAILGQMRRMGLLQACATPCDACADLSKSLILSVHPCDTHMKLDVIGSDALLIPSLSVQCIAPVTIY